MSRNDQIFELVDRWDTLNKQGQTISPEELCRDCPKLLDPVCERIAKLRAINPVLKTRDASPAQEPQNPQRQKSGSAAPESGLKTLGRYQLRKLRGRGGFGEVWEAYDPQLKRQVAIKVRRSDRTVRSDVFEAEAQKVAQLNHPGIVGVYDFGYEEDTCFIVSQWIDGMNLAEWLKKRRPKPEQAARLVASVADALEYAHAQGLIHRDVKPANVLLERQGRVLITDFGIAATQAQLAVEPFSGIGTTPYMTPEQIEGRGVRITPATDIYGLGVLLYELLTGRPPFIGDTYEQITKQIRYSPPQAIRTHNKKVPRELDDICLKALEKDPKNRYRTARDMADALRDLVASGASPSPAESSDSAEEESAGTTGLVDSVSQKLNAAYRQTVSVLRTLLVLVLLIGFAVAVGMLISQRGDPANSATQQHSNSLIDGSEGIASNPKRGDYSSGAGSTSISVDARTSADSRSVDGAQIATNLAATEESMNAIAELINACLTKLPGRVLRVRTNGDPQLVRRVSSETTLLRIPVLLEVDCDTYRTEIQAIMSTMDKLAFCRYDTQVRLRKQEPMTVDWTDTAGDSLAYFFFHNRRARAITLTIQEQMGLEDKAAFPKPSLMVSTDWYDIPGDSYLTRNPHVFAALKADGEPTKKVREDGKHAAKALVPIQIVTDLSRTGTVKIMTYGVEMDDLAEISTSFMSRLFISVRLVDKDDSEIESTRLDVRPTWQDDDHYRGFLVCVEQPDRNDTGFVGILTGSRSTWNNCHSSCLLSTSWSGHVYMEVATTDIKRMHKVEASVEWDPVTNK